MDHLPDKEYPAEPNAELLAGSPADAGEPAQSAEIKFHISGKKQKNGGVIALCVVALLLLVGVSVAGMMIVYHSAIVTNESGRFSLVIGNRNDENPFAPSATTAAPSDGTSASVELDINDPPELVTTTPVENDGVLTVPEIAKRIQPSVVSILVSNPYRSGLGSGIIMTDNGFIVTNYHVIENMTVVTVVLNNGTKYDAALIGYDESSDLAVVKIAAEGLTPAVFGNSDALEVGDLAVAVGTPYSLSLSGTTTQGIISAINRDLLIDNRVISLIQTDASINPGNSGGPLVNQYGQVVGITSMKIGEEFEGLGFAIPMNTAKTIIEELVTYGKVTGKPALGINGLFLTELRAAVNGLPVGLYVTEVHPDSDAAIKGLTAGDVITQIDGVAVTDLVAYTYLKNAHEVGDALLLTVYRDLNLYDREPGAYVDISVVLMDEALLGDAT